MLSPPGTPPPDADDGSNSSWDSCHESVSVAGRSHASHASAASIDASCGDASLLPGASDAGDSQRFTPSDPTNQGGSAVEAGFQDAADAFSRDRELAAGAVVGDSDTGEGESLIPGDEVGGGVDTTDEVSSSASTEELVIRREASLSMDVGVGRAYSHWGSTAGPRHIMVPSKSSSGSFLNDFEASDDIPRFQGRVLSPTPSPLAEVSSVASSAQAATAAGSALNASTNMHVHGSTEEGVRSSGEGQSLDGNAAADAVRANFTAWRSVSEPVGDHQWWGNLFVNKMHSDVSHIPGAVSLGTIPGVFSTFTTLTSVPPQIVYRYLGPQQVYLADQTIAWLNAYQRHSIVRMAPTQPSVCAQSLNRFRCVF